MTPWLTVVGIGEDGLDGLGESARRAVLEAACVMGAPRHLGLLPPVAGQTREPWPTPFSVGYARVLARRGTPLCVLASGDPMWHGLGASLTRHVPIEDMRVLPAPSSVSLAAARLGWPLHEVATLPLHGRDPATLHPLVQTGARLLLLANDRATPAQVAALLVDRGFGASALTVLEHLGGPQERRLDGAAGAWPHPPGADLAVIAVLCRADPGHPGGLSRLAGRPDEAFAQDGQITKRDARAIILSRLAPRPDEMLWDVGAGCGSVAVEWMRADQTCRAVAIEARADRCALIARNRTALGVPGLTIVEGQAPAALEGLAPPDAVFIGGGVTTAGVFARCLAALKPGGRLVAAAVTLQGEAVLLAHHRDHGGDLLRLGLSRAGPLGGFDGWQPARPLTLLCVTTAGPVAPADGSVSR